MLALHIFLSISKLSLSLYFKGKEGGKGIVEKVSEQQMYKEDSQPRK